MRTVEENDIKTLTASPVPSSVRLIDFESVEVRPMFVNDTYLLIVSGTKPWITMSVQLVPLIYIDKPEYWAIEVVATQSGMGLPTTGPYIATLDISHIRGTKGIEVVGATNRKKVDI